MLYNKLSGVQRRPAEIHIESLPAIKENIAEKRKLRKLWLRKLYTNRCSVLKNKLNRVIKTLKNLLKKNQGIQEYLSKLSVTPETNYSLWKATKRLKRPQIYHSPSRMGAGPEVKKKRQKPSLSIFLKFLSITQGDYTRERELLSNDTTLATQDTPRRPFTANKV